jgi:hypothetical protein
MASWFPFITILLAIWPVHSRFDVQRPPKSDSNSTCGKSTGIGHGIADGVAFPIYVGVGGDTLPPSPLYKDYTTVVQDRFECYVSFYTGSKEHFFTQPGLQVNLTVKLDQGIKANITVTDELPDLPFIKPYVAVKTITGPISTSTALTLSYQNTPTNSHFPCGVYRLAHRINISFDNSGNPTGKGHVMGRAQYGIMDFLWIKKYNTCPKDWPVCSTSEVQKCNTNLKDPWTDP